ncbi:L-threonylcarbamoyladenylate synthase [Eubacteriaceae bacterium ES3]|nr:L-threonylcarbamoyladenylate synthase [Eubacteriaceae bacterium ES3]
MKTEIYQIDGLDQTNIDKLEEAAQWIKKGETVVFPTETVYGLGADALNPAAVKKIFEAKGRPNDNPLIIHISKAENLALLVSEIPPKAKLLMEVFWPGPLTMVLKKSDAVPDEVTAGLDTVAVRLPDHPIASAFIKLAGCPIAAPSANRSGRPSPTQANHVLTDLNGLVPAMIISSDAEIGLESTVIDMTVEPPMVLRPGDITVCALRDVLGEVAVAPNVTDDVCPEKVASPGMKYTHYSPKGELIIVKGNQEEITEKIRKALKHSKKARMKIGVLATNETMDFYKEGITISLGSQADPKELAKNLYSRLRTFDDLGVEIIYAEDIPMNNETLALINRLYKAAGYHFI